MNMNKNVSNVKLKKQKSKKNKQKIKNYKGDEITRCANRSVLEYDEFKEWKDNILTVPDMMSL